MVGAIVSNEDDGQQVQWPISMTFAASLVVSAMAMENPNGAAVTVLSLIPFFGPSLMFLRIALGAATAWQIAASIGLLIDDHRAHLGHSQDLPRRRADVRQTPHAAGTG